MKLEIPIIVPAVFFNEILFQENITLAEVQILMILFQSPYTDMGDLRKYTVEEFEQIIKIDNAKISRSLKKLLKKNYILKDEIDGISYYKINYRED
jgi:DNA-binding MarR family transcriptional regulator